MSQMTEDLFLEMISNSIVGVINELLQSQTDERPCKKPCTPDNKMMNDFNKFRNTCPKMYNDNLNKCRVNMACDTEKAIIKPIAIERVLHYKPKTVVKWSDGTATVVVCHELDHYSEETGLALCICKKLMGNKMFHETFAKWCPDLSENPTDIVKENVMDIIPTEVKDVVTEMTTVECDESTAIVLPEAIDIAEVPETKIPEEFDVRDEDPFKEI